MEQNLALALLRENIIRAQNVLVQRRSAGNVRLKMDFLVALAFILAAAAVIVWITKPH